MIAEDMADPERRPSSGHRFLSQDLGVSPMVENAKARKPEEQTAEVRRQWELSHGHRREDWPDPLREPYEPTRD